MRCLARTGLLACWVGVACGAKPEPRAVTETRACDVHFRSWRSTADEGRHELVFTPDGSRLVVDGRWSIDPQAFELGPVVGCPASGTLCLPAELSFALRGGRFSVTAGERLAVGVLGRELEPFRAIPRWLPADPDAAEVSNVVGWLNQDHLLIVQSYIDKHDEPVCRVLDLGTGDFQPPAGGCPRPAFSHIGSIEPAAPGVFALHSSAEGASAEQIIRYTAERGQEEPALASVTLQGWSAVSAWVASDGARLGFTSPCDLSGASAPACEEPETLPTRVYESNPADGTLRVIRDDLPPGSVFDPQHGRFAWVADGSLCIGNPGGADTRCAPLSARAACR